MQDHFTKHTQTVFCKERPTFLWLLVIYVSVRCARRLSFWGQVAETYHDIGDRHLQPRFLWCGIHRPLIVTDTHIYSVISDRGASLCLYLLDVGSYRAVSVACYTPHTTPLITPTVNIHRTQVTMSTKHKQYNTNNKKQGENI